MPSELTPERLTAEDLPGMLDYEIVARFDAVYAALDAAEARIAALEGACYEPVPEGQHSFSGYSCRLCGWDCSPEFLEEHEPSCVLFDDGRALRGTGD